MERTIPYPGGRDIAASRDFYVGALGFEVVVEEPALCLRSPGNPAACVWPTR